MVSRHFLFALLFHAAALIGLRAQSAPYEVVRLQPSPDHPKVLFAPRDCDQAILKVVFPVGSLQDGQSPGLTRLSQHAVIKGDERGKYRDLALRLYEGAATLHFDTDLDRTAFTLVAHKDDFDKLAGEVLGRILSPKLRKQSFREVVEYTLRDTRPSNADPLQSVLASALFDDWIYLVSVPEQKMSIDEVGFDELQRHVDSTFAPRNATVLVAGAFDQEAMRRRLATFKGGLPNSTRRPAFNLPVEVELRSRLESILIAYPVALDSAEEAAGVRIISSMLQDRLYRKFRDSGLGYSFYVRPLLSQTMQLLVLLAPAHDPSNLPLAGFLLKEIDALRSGKLTDGELADYRSQLMRRLEAIDRSPALLIPELERADVCDAWYGPELRRAAEGMSRETLVEVAGKIFHEDRRLHIRLHPNAGEPK